MERWRAIQPSPVGWAAGVDLTTPWRLDVISTPVRGPRQVIPGVFRFDGQYLVWATPPTGREWCDYRSDGEYPARPTGFEPTAGSEVRRLRPCERYEQD